MSVLIKSIFLLIVVFLATRLMFGILRNCEHTSDSNNRLEYVINNRNTSI